MTVKGICFWFVLRTDELLLFVVVAAEMFFMLVEADEGAPAQSDLEHGIDLHVMHTPMRIFYYFFYYTI